METAYSLSIIFSFSDNYEQMESDRMLGCFLFFKQTCC
jgi:hypothetical protein